MVGKFRTSVVIELTQNCQIQKGWTLSSRSAAVQRKSMLYGARAGAN
jgi:hypothetical protein